MTFSALEFRPDRSALRDRADAGVFSDQARLGRDAARGSRPGARAGAGWACAAEALAAAIEAIEPASLDLAGLGAATALAGVPTIPFVKAVQKRLPAELEAAFHKGATTQDIARYRAGAADARRFRAAAEDLDAVLAGLIALARPHRATPCAGRTYGQHAAPVSFGFKAAVWLAGIARRRCAPAARSRAHVLGASLGGPVGTLAAMAPAWPGGAGRLRRRARLAAPLLAWHTRRARDRGRRDAGWRSLIGALGKMATDVASLASTEVAEVAEPHAAGTRRLHRPCRTSAIPFRRRSSSRLRRPRPGMSPPCWRSMVGGA